MFKLFRHSLMTLFMFAAVIGAQYLYAQEKTMDTNTNHETATLAGGCFWCMEAALENIPGVIEVVSGYSGGHVKNPTYEQVSSGGTGHLESVQVIFDPGVVSYAQILDAFWRHIDPTDAGGSFVDRGHQYTSAVFVHNAEQRRIAEASKKALQDSGIFDEPVVTPILDFKEFYAAEDYHQGYYKTNPMQYNAYSLNTGRKEFTRERWKGHDNPLPIEPSEKVAKEAQAMKYMKPDDGELKKRLSPKQYEVTQHEGTEAPFDNEYWDNKTPGIYVDVVTGEPLFSSTHKYNSGTGWPSFWQPLVQKNIATREDRSLFTVRTEVRSRHGDSHLGHVFDDGPEPTGQRYCINSAALRFIPADKLEEEGYGEFIHLFK